MLLCNKETDTHTNNPSCFLVFLHKTIYIYIYDKYIQRIQIYIHIYTHIVSLKKIISTPDEALFKYLSKQHAWFTFLNDIFENLNPVVYVISLKKYIYIYTRTHHIITSYNKNSLKKRNLINNCTYLTLARNGILG